jgi:hypothetical protein
MARIRTIKPDFWTDEKIVELEFADRLLFIGLWNFADDQGYMDLSLKRIKMQVFPGDDADVSRGLARLHEFGLIRVYESPEGYVLHLVNWAKHQRVSNPSRARFVDGDLQECTWEQTGLASPLEPSRVLGKGREGKGSSPSSAVASEDEPDPFDEFWEHYPRKVEKQDARKAWTAALKKTTASEIIDAVKEYPFGDDPKFIKHAATWLNKGCWADTPDNVRPIRADDPHAGKVRMRQLDSGRWRPVYDDEVLYGVHTEWRAVGDE